MRLNKALKVLTTLTPLFLWAGTALASGSGIGIMDTWSNNWGHIAQGAGFAATGVGLLGILHHVHTGSWSGGLSHLGITFAGGVAVMDYPVLSPQLGGLAAALIHPAATIASHPATHAAIHAASRLVS
ncbi:MAG: hypothetical protein JO189_03550 [Deltaproteobacteria bacterium]|jgi:hypothetical protein|nr:hypothetical protein [Deltaproteobacteria bacterium]